MRDLRRLSALVGQRLRKRAWRVVTAESCTGGWVAKALTDIAGSSQWFGEGWVVYSNLAKVQRLGVAHSTLIRHGAVSEATVRAMVRGALKLSSAQFAVAVSGIAGPGGGMPGKPVGTVWFAWGTRMNKRAAIRCAHKRFRGTRDAVRRQSVRFALEGLLEIEASIQ